MRSVRSTVSVNGSAIARSMSGRSGAGPAFAVRTEAGEIVIE